LKMHGFRAGPSRWLVLAGIFGALTAFTLLEAVPHIEGTFSTLPSAATVTGNSFAGNTLNGNAAVTSYSSGGMAGSGQRLIGC
jgi:hypothetical protein